VGTSETLVEHRLAGFGAHEDAVLADDPVMSHSLLSSSLNLGLLHPAECVERAEDAWRAGRAPVNSVEGFVRQVAGWREYVWQLYWYFGNDYRRGNALGHRAPLPDWFLELDADAVTRLGPPGGDGLVPPLLRRRVRLGDGAERHRHVAVRRRRPDDDEAVHLGRHLHPPHERLLRRLRLPAHRTRGRAGLPYTAGYWAFLHVTAPGWRGTTG
jgi:hypothetical protein